MGDMLLEQYELVRQAREVLLSFLEGVPDEVLNRPVPGFGHGSVLATHLHVADDYRFWFGEVVTDHKIPPFAPALGEPLDVGQLRERFAVSDRLVAEFLGAYGGRWSEPLELTVPWRKTPLPLSPLFLMTHTETHEFHHKGQIVSMARQLGWPPPESDALGGLRFP